MLDTNNILKEIIITEKATALSSNVNQYTFNVFPHATRSTVAKAVEKVFSVTVTKVNILNVKPKIKRDRTRHGKLGRKGGMKKAIVSLKEGDQLEVI